MILKFAELVYMEDPTFITGFNDSAFDWPFLKQKIEYHDDPDFYSAFDHGSHASSKQEVLRKDVKPQVERIKKPKTSFLLQFTKAL